MNEINIYIGGQIRKYRKANGMTLQQLADVIHKSRATVCKYESGEISIDIATLYEISQALQVSTDYLLTGNRNTSDYITLDSKLATVDSAKYDRIMRVVDIMLEET